VKFNFGAYLVIFVSLLMLLGFVIICQEEILKNDHDFGYGLNSVIFFLAEVFAFPSNMFLDATSNYLLIGILLNLCVHSLVLYFGLKFIFKKLRN